MKFIRKTIAPYVLLSGCAMAVAAAGKPRQSASLYQQDIPLTQGQPLTLANTSWLYQKVDPPKEIKLHDIVTVVVSEKNQLISEGQVQRRRKAQYDAQLQNWIAFKGLNLVASNPAEGEPRATGNLNVQNQGANGIGNARRVIVSDLRHRGRYSPQRHLRDRSPEDGARQRRTLGTRLTGIIRREDVLPNNTVLSENVAELSIFKRELGHVRDGYKRGWFTYWFDRFSPF